MKDNDNFGTEGEGRGPQERILKDLNDALWQYRQILPHQEGFLGQGAWEWNIATQTINCSTGMYLLFGYNCEDAMKVWDNIGRAFKPHLGKDHWFSGDEAWEKIFSGADTARWEMDIMGYDGVNRTLETFGKRYLDEASVLYKVVGITRDITQLKAYQKQLGEQLAELDRSNRDLESFAYMASHDLQEPLRKISTFGQRLAQDAKNELSPRNLDYLERMLRATDNMRYLIDSLLGFSRVARDTDGFSMLNLGVIISEVTAEQELLIEETGARITVDSMPVIEMIPSQARQLFNNLLNNALKFRSKDQLPEVHFTASEPVPGEIATHGLDQDLRYCRLTVKDNGIGFGMADAERIFQVFQRLNGKSAYGGSGIGLAICRKIVDHHRGVIYAESEPGEGSAFHILLPIKH